MSFLQRHAALAFFYRRTSAAADDVPCDPSVCQAGTRLRQRAIRDHPRQAPPIFTWQSNQEVQDQIAIGRRKAYQRKGASDEAMQRTRRDVLVGMLFSNVIL